MRSYNKLILGILFLFAIGSQWSCSKDDTAIDNPDTPNAQKQVDIAYVDSVVNKWAKTYNMPGVSFSVSKNGKLVYSKGYGYADNSLLTPVDNETSFRLASVSKLITAVAVMKLVDQGKIQMNQKVFGTNGILGMTYGTRATYDPRVLAVTVSDLLHHTAGGWGNGPNDPAFINSTSTQQEMLDMVMDYYNLPNSPNTKTVYSNIGYVFLERIVVRVSGMQYDEFVQKEIWNKVGAKNSYPAGNVLAQKQQNEVVYYGQAGEGPYVYTMNLKRMLGAAGWASTSTDLLRFATAVDSSTTRPDIIRPATVKVMTTTTAASSTSGWHFGCGWVVDGSEWFWYGSLPGTFAILYRNSNGICLAAIANSRFMPDTKSTNGMIGIINDLANNKNIAWQNIDQF